VIVRGRSMSTGLPTSCEVSSKEVCLAVRPMIQNILMAIGETLSDTPPELAGDLLDSGITLTGGVARMKGLASIVSEMTGLNVTVADDPELCAVVGAGRAVERMTDVRINFPELPALPVRASADF
jgi:rod shape-determining protein MreB